MKKATKKEATKKQVDKKGSTRDQTGTFVKEGGADPKPSRGGNGWPLKKN